MNAQDENRIKQLLKQTLPPVEPTRSRNAICGPPCCGVSMKTRTQRHANAVPWFDWALIGGLALFAVSFPATIPGLSLLHVSGY
jgi:hypothetical protein